MVIPFSRKISIFGDALYDYCSGGVMAHPHQGSLYFLSLKLLREEKTQWTTHNRIFWLTRWLRAEVLTVGVSPAHGTLEHSSDK